MTEGRGARRESKLTARRRAAIRDGGRRAWRTREALAAGFTRRTLQGAELGRVHRGVFVPAAGGSPDTLDRIVAAAALITGDGVIGGWAALRWHAEVAVPHLLNELTDGCIDGGDDRPRRVGPLRPVTLCLPRAERIFRSDGIRVFRSEIEAAHRLRVAGVPVSSLVRTAFDLARRQPFETAVQTVDWMRCRGLLDIGELQEYVDAHPRFRGAGQARVAVAASCDGVMSPPETALRLLWHQAVPTRLLVNPGIWSAGMFLGRPDLLDLDAGIAGEYDGAVHFTAQHVHDDRLRQERLEAAGLVVLRFVAPDLHRARRPTTLRRIVAERTPRLSRDRGAESWVWRPAPAPSARSHPPGVDAPATFEG